MAAIPARRLCFHVTDPRRCSQSSAQRLNKELAEFGIEVTATPRKVFPWSRLTALHWFGERQSVHQAV
jgi:hypothetical protein